MQIKVGVRVGRGSDNIIRLSVSDEKSNEGFLEIQFTPEQFALAITNLSMEGIKAEVDGLEYVGKTKIVENRTIEIPKEIVYSNDKIQSQWLIDNGQEEGWIVNPYLGSQGSKTYKDGKHFFNYTVHKYITD